VKLAHDSVADFKNSIRLSLKLQFQQLQPDIDIIFLMMCVALSISILILQIISSKPGVRKNTDNTTYGGIEVQLDDGSFEIFNEPGDLKLYDNGQTGI
jgi:hypothetical protein